MTVYHLDAVSTIEPSRLHLSLDGPWELTLDPEDIGVSQRWFLRGRRPEGMPVTVPAVWDLWVPDYDGVGWYHRSFELDAGWRDRRVLLRFAAADYYAEVWVNGVPVGTHEGGYTPFTLDVTDATDDGENDLTVRIVDPHGDAGYRTFRSKQIPCAKERDYHTFAGLWGGVTLAGVAPAYIADVFVQPDIRKKRIVVEATVAGEAADPRVRLRIADTPFETEDAPGLIPLDFPEHEVWTPDTPVRYTLISELLVDGAVVDRTETRFGMREFTVRDSRFWLNHHPIFIKGVLHQPDYPLTLAAPADADMARRELELAKQAGFNLIRLHIKTAPEITLDLCDELGLLVYEEPPIGWIQHSPSLRERCEREVREMVLRDRNHPSVVIWGMLNESGSHGCDPHGGAQPIKADLCRLARSLDPTRLILDDSGGMNITREATQAMPPGRDAFEPIDDLHIYQRGPVDAEILRYFRYSGTPETPSWVSEFGFGGVEDLASILEAYGPRRADAKDARYLERVMESIAAGFDARGLDRIFGSVSGFAAATQEIQRETAMLQIDAMRQNAKLMGYCYTQLCDAGHEISAGALDHWRRPKPVHKGLRAAQASLRPVIQMSPINLRPRQEAPVQVTIVNDDRREGRADLSLQVVGPTNQVLWKKKRSVALQRTGREIWSGRIGASSKPGRHRFVVRLLQGVKMIAESEVSFHVYPATESSDVTLRVLDPNNVWGERCAPFGRLGDDRPLVHVVPPLADTVRAYPAEDLALVIEEVRQGAVAIVFGPPDDWNDLADCVDPGLRATSRPAFGEAMGVWHYVKLHPVFEGLPSRCLMDGTYANLVPPKTFAESGDEDICGAFDLLPAASGLDKITPDAPWWGDNLLVRRYGSGRIIFTHLRVLENLGDDPLADRLFVNMLRHFGRRSVPAGHGVMPDPRALDWLTRERGAFTRRWQVIGPFPNWNGEGHETAYPPEDGIDFNAVYPGWYGPVRWTRCHAQVRNDCLVDLQAAFSPVYQSYPRYDYGTGYAYAEVHAAARQSVVLRLGIQDATKVWLNGRLLFEDAGHRPLGELEKVDIAATMKQGRNALLVKVSKTPGEFRFSLDIEPVGREPLICTWWR